MAIEQVAPEKTTLSCEFDSDDADLILLSRDPPTEFHVHSTILAAASTFFSDMLTIPQPPTSPNSLKYSKPVIPLTESTDTIAALLHFVYPLPAPKLTALDELPPLLDAAIKYDFTSVIDTLRRLLVSHDFLRDMPTQIYAIACRFDLDEEAQIASAYTLGHNILDGPLCEDLKYISAWQYHRLLDLHRTRSKRAQEIIDSNNCPPEIKCIQCNSSMYTSHGQPKWYYEWEKEAKLELAVRPVSDVIFSIPFMGKATQKAGCARCSDSVFQCWQWLLEMKNRIDELPSTV